MEWNALFDVYYQMKPEMCGVTTRSKLIFPTKAPPIFNYKIINATNYKIKQPCV